MAQIILLNKPFNVLCQFTDKEKRSTLADFIDCNLYPDFYPAGRLDYDSEGLVILTNNGSLQHQISHPKTKQGKCYWVQVEGEPDESQLTFLRQGIELKDGRTLPATAERIAEPSLWPRNPPIRERKNQATSWLALTLKEGKNRQVRRMTAAIGHPTLRLVRHTIGAWKLGSLKPGEYRVEEVHLPKTTTHKQRNRKTFSSRRPRK